MPGPQLCYAARQRAEPFRPAPRPPPLMGRLLSRASPAQKAPLLGVTPRCAGRCRGATEGSGPEGLAALADWGIPTGLTSPPANLEGDGLPPSLAPLVRHPSTPLRRGRACPARSLASAPGFVLHPLYLLHRREGVRGCEQGPRLSGAKPGCEQCLPLRGKQPHERVCEANWRRSLCAAKRPRTPAAGNSSP